jgi:penicillin-binding protein 2
MAIPPGSVFKPAAAVALLQAVDMDPAAPLVCRGYLQTPDRQRCMLFRRHGMGHGPTNLADALAQSCNVYFFHYANKIGPEALISWAMRLGFGQRTGIDLPAEAAANLPTIQGGAAGDGDGWQLADSQALAIGQGRLTATPLQVVRMMAAIANGGYLITPRVTRDLVDSGEVRDVPATAEGIRIPGLHEATLQTVRQGLLRVVADPAGTAHRTVFIEGLPVAGKTGTAQVAPDQEDHAWFAGYAPADDPRIALVVVLEHAGDGSAAAGPAARQLLLTLRQLGYFAKK